MGQPKAKLKEGELEYYKSVVDLCKSRSEFQQVHQNVVSKAKRRGVWPELKNYLHQKLPRLQRVSSYTPDEVIARARTYRTIKEFMQDSPYYYAAHHLKLMPVIREFLEVSGNRVSRRVYIFEHQGKTYTGITYNLNERLNQHLASSRASFFRSALPIYISPLMPIAEALNEEIFWIEELKNLGFESLNKMSGGQSGGGHETMSYEELKEFVKDKTPQFIKKNHTGVHKRIRFLPEDQKAEIRALQPRTVRSAYTYEDLISLLRSQDGKISTGKLKELNPTLYQVYMWSDRLTPEQKLECSKHLYPPRKKGVPK